MTNYLDFTWWKSLENNDRKIILENIEDSDLNFKLVDDCYVTDDEFFDKLNKVTKLYINIKSISSVKFISNFINLKELTIKYTGILSLKGIENLINLEKLDISHNLLLMNINDLRNLPNLNTLVINSTGNIINFSAINELYNLRKLSLLNLKDNLIDNINPDNKLNFNTLNKLTDLTIFDTKINDTYIKNINSLYNLNRLCLNKCEIFSLKGFNNLINVKYLDVSLNNIKSLDGLQSYTNLIYLTCDNNNLESLDGINNCSSLEELRCNYNNLSSLDPLPELNFLNLKEVYCYNNPINILYFYKDLIRPLDRYVYVAF